jgi:hypothetical protein
MPAPSTLSLDPPIHINALYERIKALCDALGLAWSPEHTPAVIDHRAQGSFTLETTTSSWSDGAIALMLYRETGDNGATDHMAWQPWFVANATLDGLPGGASVHLEGQAWGASELTHVRVEGADEAMTATILAALGAQR